MPPSISILIPSYNRADLIAETLDSILGQTLPPAEVIVVDDGSKDNTRDVVARFGDRVRYHRQENAGVCRARNTAASLATGEYFALCDSDDLWLKDKLEQQWQLHARDPALQYSFTNFSEVIDGVWREQTKFDSVPADLFAPGPLPTSGAFLVDHPIYDALLRFQPIWPSTVMISQAYFRQLGGFDETFSRNPIEDFEFTLRCGQGPSTGIVCAAVVGARKHSSNLSGNNYKNTLGEIAILEHALAHHTVSAASKAIISEEIELRSVDASWGAFQSGDFAKFVALVGGLPPARLDSRTKLKLAISRLPKPLAGALRSFLVRT